MADLTEADKKVLFGPDYKAVDAQITADRARSLEKWKRIVPVAALAIAAILGLIVASEAFF